MHHFNYCAVIRTHERRSLFNIHGIIDIEDTFDVLARKLKHHKSVKHYSLYLTSYKNQEVREVD